MPYIERKDWNAVYKNQDRLLGVLQKVDSIFLAGGTAIQRFTASFQARESDDLDFFIPTPDDKLAARKALEIRKAIETSGFATIQNYYNDSGVNRFICSVEGSEELVKVELVNCTTDRFGKEPYQKHVLFPRIETAYDLMLYKLKALHDRQDTVKDLFDLYFLFREWKDTPLLQQQLFMDLLMKFEVSTGYKYTETHILQALETKHRRWDIVLRETNAYSKHDVMDAIDQFRREMIVQILDPDKEYFYLNYHDIATLETRLSPEEYYSLMVPNRFSEYGYTQWASHFTEAISKRLKNK